MKDWPELVTSQYKHQIGKLTEEERNNDYIKELTLKKVGWRVAKFMARSCEKPEVSSLEDKMSCAIVALRAFERKDWKALTNAVTDSLS